MKFETIFLMKEEQKRPEHYAKAKNPKTLWEKNFMAKHKLIISSELVEAFRNGDQDAANTISEYAAAKGARGSYGVRLLQPSPGRSSFKPNRRQGGGFPKIGELEVG